MKSLNRGIFFSLLVLITQFIAYFDFLFICFTNFHKGLTDQGRKDDAEKT